MVVLNNKLFRSAMAVFALTIAGCSQGETIVGPDPSGATTTTSTRIADSAPEDVDSDDAGETSEIVTSESSPTTAAPTDATSGDDTSVDGSNGESDLDIAEPVFVPVQDSPNIFEFQSLADSGLILSEDAQTCADQVAASEVDAGKAVLDSLVQGVVRCAEPSSVERFASRLLQPGGEGLPEAEAVCVSGKLQDGDDYLPFWEALLGPDDFDFLVADDGVQSLYLDLYSKCVSVGRALSVQTAVDLSTATIGCIDTLYEDPFFVRQTIESDLSGDPQERKFVNDQIATCLTDDERSALGV